MVDRLKPEHFLFYVLEKAKSFRLYDPIFFSTSNKPAYLLENMQPTSPKLSHLTAEMELPKIPTGKQKQPISIPFIWETKPGTPKNDWKPVKPSRAPPPPPPPPPTQPPIKLISLNPFEWEENPTKPTSYFPQPTKEIVVKDENASGNKREDNDEKEMIFKADFESFNFKTEKSFDSVPLPGKEVEIYGPLESFNPFLSPKQGKGKETWNELETVFETNLESFCFKTDELVNQLEPQPPLQSPTKHIASVPFKWEEKPGIPLASFPFPTLVYSHYTNDLENDDASKTRSEDGIQTTSESDFETLSFHTDESFSSVPSLLANRLVPSVDIANAIPVLETPHPQAVEEELGYESDSSTSSYMTGTTSLVGAPFLERLFPLLSPKLSFLEKVGGPEEKEKQTKDRNVNLASKDFVCQRGFSVAMRRPMTLEELIMMSRRKSHFRKAIPIKRHDSLGSMKKREIGCFMFKMNNRIEELQRKMKSQLQLKLL